MSGPVTERLLASRVDLLDLSLRNPLLNYRPSTRRGVEIIDETSAQVFGALGVDGLSLRFHATKTAGTVIDAGGGATLAVEDETAAPAVGLGAENAANSLATPYTREVLAHRLLETHYDAWLSLQEQGANTLFLALGMLRWREDAEARQDRRAPLVLLPVRLERKSARAAWHLLAADEDPGVNLSLVEKLKEYHLRVPSEPPLETAEQLGDFYGAVENAVAERDGWAVERDRIVLGFFSFGKFLMYRDLDPAAWPAERAPGRHETLAALLLDGFRDRGGSVPPDRTMDELRPSGATMEIMDADGSQAEALAEVAAGRPLVIQGPPGTGKSQTISNLVAEAVHAGKRVLFVAEKLAALEVVRRRLENAGLGELCLELHSHKASRKAVAAELGRTLSAGKPLPPAADGLDALPASRDRLNRYATALRSPVGATGLSAYQAIGLLQRLRDRAEPLPAIATDPVRDWDRGRTEEAAAVARDLGAAIGETGIPARHPFEGCGLTALVPGQAEALDGSLRAAAAAAREALGAAGGLARAVGAAAAADLAGLEAWIGLARVALQAPELAGLPAVGPAWDRPEAAAALTESADRAATLRTLRAAQGARLLPQAWTADLLSTRADLAAGTSWLHRLFSGRYRAAKRAIQGLSLAPVPTSRDELLAAADAVLAGQQLRKDLVERAGAVKELLGARAPAEDAPWDGALAIRDWALRFRRSARGLPESVAAWVVGPWDRAALSAALAAGEKAAAALRSSWTDVAERLAFPAEVRGQLAAWPFAQGFDQAERWRAALGRLPAYVAYARLKLDLERLGLGELASLAHDGRAKPGDLPDAVRQAWAQAAVDRAFRERPELAQFDAATHEQAVQRFRQADAAVFPVNRARLAEIHWRSLPGPVGYGQVGLLRRETAKKARHLPIRRLMQQAGRAVQALKPVFLMSPLSVAQYLPPDGPTFDLVVFDEASQVRPVDAFGALLRGRQLVVVGDDKQMPPTSFFDHMLSPEGPGGDEEGEGSPTADLQSILGLCVAKGMPSRMLRWHYRSRHDSLIALSNREFYEDGLVVFPSPRRRGDGEGLEYRHLPDTAYERGTTRTNPREAEAVADAVYEHWKTRPSLSLGVVAFSMAQREAIEERIEALQKKDPAFDAWASEPREEPFFVKNLENVQGDERDVMLISVGYGRDEKGAVTMNFGPLNQAGGERRLNVLITRARRRCAVFTNLQPEDVDLRRAPGEGVRTLRAFLAFARDGRLESAGVTAVGARDDVRAQVRSALQAAGYAVKEDVGSGGYRVDLAVEDPASPGRFLIGIELDGPPYQDARWARDRDRLRESVLRGLGWSLHRIWATDWFLNREAAQRRCVSAIERAKAAAPAPSAPAPLGGLKRDGRTPPPGRAPAPPYVPAKATADIGEQHIADVDAVKRAAFVAAIVEREAPMHVEELRRRILEAIDARAGSKRLQAIDEAVEVAVGRALIRRRGDFLWSKDDRIVTPRDRSELPDASRDLALVSDEECEAALRRVVEEAHGCDADEAAAQAIRLLGVKRTDAAFERLRRVGSDRILSLAPPAPAHEGVPRV